VSGSASATLKTTLETNLPVLVQVAGQAQVALTAVEGIATGMGNVTASLTSAGVACAGELVTFGGQVTTAVAASLNVQASFSASVSVSGSATGSTS
jgi:hypothetical protein